MALAIAKNRPYCKVTGIDASDGALNIALDNIQVLKIMNVCLHESNWFSALDGEKFDVDIPMFVLDALSADPSQRRLH